MQNEEGRRERQERSDLNLRHVELERKSTELERIAAALERIAEALEKANRLNHPSKYNDKPQADEIGNAAELFNEFLSTINRYDGHSRRGSDSRSTG